MQSEVRFRWRQRPPKDILDEHKRIASRLRKGLQRELPARPWRARLKVTVSAEGPEQRHLVMWVIAPNPFDAFWAASLMGLFHRCVAAIEPRIARLVVTARKEPETGYTPLISWRFFGADTRSKTIRESELQGFARHMRWCAASAMDSHSKRGISTDLLMHTTNSPGIQWEAVEALVCHASRQSYLKCGVEEALSVLADPDDPLEADATGAAAVTRWKAIKRLVTKDRLDGFVGGQRPLRPPGSTARLDEIREMVAMLCGLTAGQLAGRDRQAPIMHARYLAAAIMRRATSRSLLEIGAALGNRDHATIINGLERIEKWRRLDPFYAGMIEQLAQIADDMGILMVPRLREAATRKLRAEYEQLEKSSPDRPVPQSRTHSGEGNVITVPFGAMRLVPGSG
ncbi:MAG: hypothetical protein OXF74_07145 [Rhodobacteraceae bacterium]|nr:hypothetical protein [Paracoccaceae bacterium]